MDTKEYQLIYCYQIFICALASKNLILSRQFSVLYLGPKMQVVY